MTARAQLMLPAARSDAVRQHSASLYRPGGRSGACRWPWPAARSSPWPAAPPFFVPFPPRPIDIQSIWWPKLAERIGPGGVGTGTCLGTRLGTRKPPNFNALRHCSHCSHAWRAHVIRSRARTCRQSLSFLGTWIQTSNIVCLQGVGCSQASSQRQSALGTWEQAGGSARGAARRWSGSNKVEAGYGAQRPQGGCGGRKFRGSIARSAGLGLVAIEQLRPVAATDPRIGGFAPFSGRRQGHVGRAMLEGVGQAAAIIDEMAKDQKLPQLATLRLARGDRAELEQLAGDPARHAQGEGGTPPIAARASSGMLALDVDRVWIAMSPKARKDALQAGPLIDRAGLTSEKNAQNSRRRRGPGGFRPIRSARGAVRSARHGEAGKRAGVNLVRRCPRPHEAGGMGKLRAAVTTVKRPTAQAVDNWQ